MCAGTLSGNLYAETEGNGPDLLILHGLMGSCENWRYVSRALSGSYRVTRLDLPGHGRSPSLDSDDIGAWADTVLDSAHALGIRKTILLGHSMGGKIAMDIASRYPQFVEGLVVVDMTPRAFPPVHLFVLRACLALPLKTFSTRREIKDALMKWIPFEQTCDFLLKNIVRSSSGSFEWSVPLESLIKNYKVVSDAVDLSVPYAGPSTFILGQDSSFHVIRDSEEILKKFPNAEFKEIPHAGHLVHMDAPEEFIEALKTALGRIERSCQ